MLALVLDIRVGISISTGVSFGLSGSISAGVGISVSTGARTIIFFAGPGPHVGVEICVRSIFEFRIKWEGSSHTLGTIELGRLLCKMKRDPVIALASPFLPASPRLPFWIWKNSEDKVEKISKSNGLPPRSSNGDGQNESKYF